MQKTKTTKSWQLKQNAEAGSTPLFLTSRLKNGRIIIASEWFFLSPARVKY